MAIAFRHWNFNIGNKDRRRTFFVQVPEKELLVKINHLRKEGLTILFGVAKCHPNDQFNKSIGRRQAAVNADYYFFKLKCIDFETGRRIFVFENDCYELEFSVSDDSPQTRFESVMEIST